MIYLWVTDELKGIKDVAEAEAVKECVRWNIRWRVNAERSWTDKLKLKSYQQRSDWWKEFVLVQELKCKQREK